MKDSYFGSYLDVRDGRNMLSIASPTNCLPSDGRKQIITLENNMFNHTDVFPMNSDNGIDISYWLNYERPIQIIIDGLEMYHSRTFFYRAIGLIVSNGDILLQNVYLEDVQSSLDDLYIEGDDTIIVRNLTMKYCGSFGRRTFSIYNAHYIEIDGFEHTDFPADRAPPNGVLILDTPNSIVLSGLYFHDN